MPNWNSNDLKVIGKGKHVKKFIKENFKTHKFENEFEYILDFEQFNPTPIDEETGEIISEWYNWRLTHWGCKWSPSVDQCICLTINKEDGTMETIYDQHSEIQFDEKLVDSLDDESEMQLELDCFFETPWGPPEAIFYQWYERYKDLGLEVRLQFYEPGIAFAGELWFSGEEFCDEIVEPVHGNRKDYVKYLLDAGWESAEWYIEECFDLLRDMHSDEVLEKLMPKIEEMIKNGSNEEIATLVNDIYNKWNEFEKGDNNAESSEK